MSEAHGARAMAPASPSSWRERGPLAAAAAAGLAVSLCLAAFQVGIVPAPWDPIFGPASSARVLHSSLSRALPVPDAVLGAFAYAVELVLDLAGGVERWRTHPWIALAFAAAALGLGAAGVGLALVQAFVVRAGCALCLTSAAISVAIAVAVALGRELPAAFASAFRTAARRSV